MRWGSIADSAISAQLAASWKPLEKTCRGDCGRSEQNALKWTNNYDERIQMNDSRTQTSDQQGETEESNVCGCGSVDLPERGQSVV